MTSKQDNTLRTIDTSHVPSPGVNVSLLLHALRQTALPSLPMEQMTAQKCTGANGAAGVSLMTFV